MDWLKEGKIMLFMGLMSDGTVMLCIGWVGMAWGSSLAGRAWVRFYCPINKWMKIREERSRNWAGRASLTQWWVLSLSGPDARHILWAVQAFLGHTFMRFSCSPLHTGCKCLDSHSVQLGHIIETPHVLRGGEEWLWCLWTPQRMPAVSSPPPCTTGAHHLILRLISQSGGSISPSLSSCMPPSLYRFVMVMN